MNLLLNMGEPWDSKMDLVTKEDTMAMPVGKAAFLSVEVSIRLRKGAEKDRACWKAILASQAAACRRRRSASVAGARWWKSRVVSMFPAAQRFRIS